MTPSEQQLLEACEALYEWIFLPNGPLLGAVQSKAEAALRLYESSLPAQRARLQKEAQEATP